MDHEHSCQHETRQLPSQCGLFYRRDRIEEPRSRGEETQEEVEGNKKQRERGENISGIFSSFFYNDLTLNTTLKKSPKTLTLEFMALTYQLRDKQSPP